MDVSRQIDRSNRERLFIALGIICAVSAIDEFAPVLFAPKLIANGGLRNAHQTIVFPNDCPQFWLIIITKLPTSFESLFWRGDYAQYQIWKIPGMLNINHLKVANYVLPHGQGEIYTILAATRSITPAEARKTPTKQSPLIRCSFNLKL